MEVRTPLVGVVGEYFLVHPGTRAVEPAGGRVVARAARVLGDLVSGEFTAYQIEGKTPPCPGSEDLRSRLTRVRAAVSAAAREEGLRLCASGTPVIGGEGPAPVGDHPRYRPNPRLPTVEIRSMDVPTSVDDTVALAVLIRGARGDRGGAGRTR